MYKRTPHENNVAKPVNLEDETSRIGLAKMLIRLFELWDLNTATQLSLLGLSQKSRSLLKKYKEGEPLPKNRDVLDRAGWLLAIHKALRLLYPYNKELRYSWVKRRNVAFNNLTPLDLMQEEGLIGIAKVSRYLDFQRGH
jgi:Protein of unknown function (DUF2384)